MKLAKSLLNYLNTVQAPQSWTLPVKTTPDLYHYDAHFSPQVNQKDARKTVKPIELKKFLRVIGTPGWHAEQIKTL